jgi:ATP-dependent Zn protease
MAEAVAGETGRPYVFVDPGAFVNMFFGIGVLKVKGLFRKLRKLALRYGGVIVFFDEADTLGSRGGQVSQSRPGKSNAEFHALVQHACNGRAYVSDLGAWAVVHSMAHCRRS